MFGGGIHIDDVPITRRQIDARGERTEAAAIAELVKLGFTVLLPFGDNRRYDIAVEVCGRFLRVQCKTGRLRNGRIEFRAASSFYQPEGATKRYRSLMRTILVPTPSPGSTA